MTSKQASLIFALLLSACDQGSAPSATTAEQAPAAAPAPADPSLGQLGPTDAIDLRAVVNKSPEQVAAALGEATATGSDRISCVRFVPERVFFACEQEVRKYAHPGFGEVRVDFEDGKAAQVSVIGLPGSGDFDPRAALTSVGLHLPGEPRATTQTLAPVDGSAGDTAEIWDWGNSGARLVIDGLQHRVRVSVVAGDWARSKVEIINNNPLDADQKARIKPVRGEAGPASTPAEASSSDQVSADPG